MSQDNGLHAEYRADFGLVQTWLFNCSKHPVCSEIPVFGREGFLPTRLIEVDTIDGNKLPRLIDTSNITASSDSRYIALSHCWGDPKKVPKTVKDTLAKHQIAISGLSRTMLHAIEVTQRLGLRYIWIDSLCIIQEDEADFHKECAVMSLVYANAYLTISAQGARDGDDGLFVPPQTRIGEQAERSDWNIAIQGPLSTRGWAFQEHQLSPRVIHFTASKMVWECRVVVACEDKPGSLHRAVSHRETPGDRTSQLIYWRLFDGRSDRLLEGKNRSAYDGHFRNDIYTRWLRAVELYSARQLTYNSDKLVAVSGLAAASAEIIGNKDYYAGIWGDDFLRGLLWYPAQHSASTPSPLQPSSGRLSLLPSWSWASYPGSVHFLATDIGQLDRNNMRYKGVQLSQVIHQQRAEIQRYTISSGQDPFIDVSDGVIRIPGFYISEELIMPDDPNPPQVGPFGQRLTDLPYMEVFLDYEYSRHNQPLRRTCITLVRGQTTSFGLIVQRVAGKYQRMGIFVCSNPPKQSGRETSHRGDLSVT